jgi:hypothetical protein
VRDAVTFGVSANSLNAGGPELFRVTASSSTGEREAALWRWYREIEKSNPNWQWERDIRFFGQAVDQTNKPIENARVTFQWAAGELTPERTVYSGADGRFELTNVKGKRLEVRVAKEGYHSGSASFGSFEYAAFWEDIFLVPDQTKPVLFRLYKRGTSEPLYFWSVAKNLPANGSIYRFDLTSGTFGDRGEIEFAITRRNEKGPREFDYTVTVQSANTSGIAITDDELMVEAPLGGYRNSLQFQEYFGTKEFTHIQKLRFYVRTAGGKYAAVQGQIAQMAAPEAQIQMVVYFNPNGSRNLEYDPARRINP